MRLDHELNMEVRCAQLVIFAAGRSHPELPVHIYHLRHRRSRNKANTSRRRAKLKYLSFLRKRCNVNPARGPFHYRAPSKILWRTIRVADKILISSKTRIRLSLECMLCVCPYSILCYDRQQLLLLSGMLPHKIERGKAALRRLKVCEGIPPPYNKRKRWVVPGALRVMCLKPGRKYCHLGRLSHEVGWKYQQVVRTLENKRKAREYITIRKNECLKKVTYEAGKQVEKVVAPFTQVIQSFGYR
uniref:60S ribosomal protein L13a n=1 Tax=Timema douglasi TaxID=61478 RepID=A0A7R8ZAF4_TIMDO|nr:unnamed protein product [Timema douglasi]